MQLSNGNWWCLSALRHWKMANPWLGRATFHCRTFPQVAQASRQWAWMASWATRSFCINYFASKDTGVWDGQPFSMMAYGFFIGKPRCCGKPMWTVWANLVSEESFVFSKPVKPFLYLVISWHGLDCARIMAFEASTFLSVLRCGIIPSTRRAGVIALHSNGPTSSSSINVP